MSDQLISTLVNIIFLVIVVIFAIFATVGIYIVIKHGETKTLTLFGSLIFAALFVIQVLIAFNSLQSIF